MGGRRRSHAAAVLAVFQHDPIGHTGRRRATIDGEGRRGRYGIGIAISEEGERGFVDAVVDDDDDQHGGVTFFG